MILLLNLFLPLLRRFNTAEPVVKNSVILQRIKMSRAFPRMLLQILLQLPVGYHISPLKRVKFKIATTSRQASG
jgi:hypothetical protein